MALSLFSTRDNRFGSDQSILFQFRQQWIQSPIAEARIWPNRVIYNLSNQVPMRGSMHQLKQMVENFTWDSLRTEARAYAGHILLSDAEFVHKLFGNLWRDNLPGTAYTTQRIFDGATMYGVFITTDSFYYQEVEPAVGSASNWSHYHRLLSGIETSPEDTTSVGARGKLALQLYRETASLLLPTLNEQRHSVVEQVLNLIEKGICFYLMNYFCLISIN